MTEAVVDQFEVIQVHHEHGRRLGVPVARDQRVGDAIEEQRAVGQPRQLVVERPVADLLLHVSAAYGLGEDVRQRIQERRTIRWNRPGALVVNGENPERGLELADEHGYAATHAVVHQPLRGREAPLTLPVFDDRQSADARTSPRRTVLH